MSNALRTEQTSSASVQLNCAIGAISMTRGLGHKNDDQVLACNSFVYPAQFNYPQIIQIIHVCLGLLFNSEKNELNECEWKAAIGICHSSVQCYQNPGSQMCTQFVLKICEVCNIHRTCMTCSGCLVRRTPICSLHEAIEPAQCSMRVLI